MSKSVTEQVRIFDTTLRDGEQAPGCSMTLREKLRVAEALNELRVDVIEAGFAAASPGDFEAVKAVAELIEHASVCSLARCNPEDIEKAARAVEPAKRPRIHVFVATSAIHREHKLNMAKEEIIRSAVGAIEMARGFCDDVEFSPEDASRTEELTLPRSSRGDRRRCHDDQHPGHCRLHGAGEFDDLFRYLRENVTGIEQAVLSCIATTISAWRSPTVLRRCAPARVRSSARSTASASAPAIARSRRLSWRCARARVLRRRHRHRHDQAVSRPAG